MSENLVLLETFSDFERAKTARTILEDSGFRAVLVNSTIPEMLWNTKITTERVELMVEERFLEDVRTILAEEMHPEDDGEEFEEPETEDFLPHADDPVVDEPTGRELLVGRSMAVVSLGCFCVIFQFIKAAPFIRLGGFSLAILGLAMVVRMWTSEERLAKEFRYQASLVTALCLIMTVAIGYAVKLQFG